MKHTDALLPAWTGDVRFRRLRAEQTPSLVWSGDDAWFAHLSGALVVGGMRPGWEIVRVWRLKIAIPLPLHTHSLVEAFSRDNV